MITEITATAAARNFSDILNRVRYRGETFEVVRGGEVVARITATPALRPGRAAELIAALDMVGGVDTAFAMDLERIQAEQPSFPIDPWDS